MGTSGNKKIKTVLFVLISVLVIIIGIIAFVLVSGRMKQNNYVEAISSAEKYVLQNRYEDAIVQYKKAITINPKDEEAYLGLAEVYISLGDFSKAKAILSKGFAMTSSAEIKRAILHVENELGVGNYVTENKIDLSKIDLTTASEGIKLDAAFLQKVVNFTFQDFKDEFGSVASTTKNSEGYIEVTHSKFDGVCYYKNTKDNKNIVDNSKKMPKPTGMPEKVTLGSLGILFRNFDGAVGLDKLQILLSQRVQPITKDGRTYIEAELEDCIIRIETDQNGNIVSDKVWNEILLPNANKENKTSGRVEGVVINAVTGDGVAGATLTFNLTEGTRERTTTKANQSGAFGVELGKGKYKVTIEAENYITEEFTCEVEEGKNYSGVQYVISPELASGTARIVLEWNSQPRDLDSYLSGRTDSGHNVDISYQHMTSTGGGNTLATLDVDDTDGYGPETTTIHDLNGVYTFTVKDYTRSGEMAQCGATVKIYLPGQEPVTITLDSGSNVENIWSVCEIDHGNLRIINRSAD